MGLAVSVALLPTPEVPPFAKIKERYESSDVDVLDKDGRLLSRVRRDFSSRRLVWKSLDSLPANLSEDLIHSEDKNFHQHRGVDVEALVAATWQRWRYGSSRGGSTISYQLVRLLFPEERGRTFGNRVRQAKLALELDRKWGKGEILEAYLNLAPFRGEARGIEAAAWSEFRLDASHLNASESAWLVSRLRGPNASLEKVAQRACWLRPEACPEVTELQAKLAKGIPQGRRSERALHLSYRASSLARGGRIKTKVDSQLQEFAEKSLQTRLREIEGQNVKDGAVLVLDNASGEVLAYVGSSGPISDAPEVDGVQAVRQVGSTLKPFLYALAIQKNVLEPDSWIDDSPLEITFPSGVYRPRNHDREFRGWVRVRQALGSSLNVPAVKALSMMPLVDFWQLLRDLGFHQLRSPDDYGPALALGVADMSLWDLTNAYRTFANRGVYRPARMPGRPVEELERRVFTEETVSTIEKILLDPENRVLGFGVQGARMTPSFRAAFKTGTSKDMRDNWCLGWTKDYTVGVWIGNFDGASMWDVSGLTGSAPIWLDIVSELHRRSPQDLPEPSLAFREVQGPVRAKRPKILYPRDGLILAKDPDIPERMQKVPFVTDSLGRGDLVWSVNGQFFAQAKDEKMWTPVRGKHRIELSDGKNVFEQIEIIVK